jgi:hypothetical protein
MSKGKHSTPVEIKEAEKLLGLLRQHGVTVKMLQSYAFANTTIRPETSSATFYRIARYTSPKRDSIIAASKLILSDPQRYIDEWKVLNSAPQKKTRTDYAGDYTKIKEQLFKAQKKIIALNTKGLTDACLSWLTAAPSQSTFWRVKKGQWRRKDYKDQARPSGYILSLSGAGKLNAFLDRIA